MKTAELELDDLVYRLHYDYYPPQPASYSDPASGGVEPDGVEVILPGNVHQWITEYTDLDVFDRLVEIAYSQERECAA